MSVADTKELLETVREHTSTTDAGSVLPDALVNYMKPRGLFSLLLPRANGGAQMDYPAYIELVKAIAEVDASTAWCVNQGSVLASTARFIEADVASTIWSGPDVVLSNGPPASTHSKQAGDVYRLSGSWSFSSGINHADWVMAVAKTTLADGTSAARWHLMPRAEVSIDETWEVNGLRKTGSFRFHVEDHPVPASRVFEYTIFDDDPPLYQITLNLLFAGGFAAVALGNTRAAIDFARQRTLEKVKRFDRETLAQDTATQDILGRSEATWHAADSFLAAAANNLWEACQAKVHAPDREKYLLRLAATHAIREAKNATDMVYNLCSTDSIFTTEGINRYFQDAHVISQHLQGRPEVYSIYGRHVLGLPETSFLV